MSTYLARSAKTCGFLGVMLAVSLTVGAVPVGEAPVPQENESITFSMVANHVGTGRGGQTQVMITITRWSTSDERDQLEEVFDQGGMQALAQGLREAPEVGFIRAPSLQATAWRLRYAMMFRGDDGKRIIRIATDRPISFQEGVQRRVMTWDFNVTLIELSVDDEGNGDGALFTGVEFAYDASNDALTIKNLSSQPVRLNNVRMTQ